MNVTLKNKLKVMVPNWLLYLGIKLLSLKALLALPGLCTDYIRFRRMSKRSGRRMPVKFRDLYPVFGEATTNTRFDHHYVYHPAWAARIVRRINPVAHTDISSTLQFCAILSAFIPVNFYDYRPAQLELANLNSGRSDLTSLPFKDDEITSLSCMHTVEHIGLGRYGDRLDPEGDLKAIKELKRVVARGGSLLFVVPIGAARTMFNAHRIYSYQQIVEYFSDMRLEEFSLITDSGVGGDFIINATKEDADAQIYGCGCFWFIKD